MSFDVRGVCIALMVGHALLAVLFFGVSDYWYWGWRTSGYGVVLMAAVSTMVGVVVVIRGVLNRSSADAGWGAALLLINVLPWATVVLVGWRLGS